jgi:hypothetical protein
MIPELGEMARDMEDWSDKRLRQWLDDSLERYEIADVERGLAVTLATISLVIMLAKILASTNVTAEDAGDRLAESIRQIRHERARKTRRQRP